MPPDAAAIAESNSQPLLETALNQQNLAELTGMDKPSWMHDDADAAVMAPPQAAPQAPPAQYAPPPQAPPPQYAPPPDLLNRIRYVEQRNAELESRAELASMYEQAMLVNPEAAELLLNGMFNRQIPSRAEVEAQTAPAAATPETPSAAQQRSSDGTMRISPHQLRQIMENQENLRLQQEAMQLELQLPGVFNRQQVAQYCLRNGIRSLQEGFERMIGQGLVQNYRSQITNPHAAQQAAQQQQYEAQRQAQYAAQQQQYAAQQAAWQQAQYAQQMGYAPQQGYGQYQGYPQQWAPNAGEPMPPPQYPGAVVGRPGGRAPQVAEEMFNDPNAGSRSWNEIEAAMIRDARRLGFSDRR